MASLSIALIAALAALAAAGARALPAAAAHAVKPVAARPAKGCANTHLRPAPTNLSAIDAATLCLIDLVRARRHLRTLRFNPRLQRVASGQSRDMVAGNYFADRSLSGETPLQRVLSLSYVPRGTPVCTAQNIGWGIRGEATPAAMLGAWMRSVPHRLILLAPGFRDLGVGVAPAAPGFLSQGQPGATYTAELGAPC
ncbi:MAG TPA: CAP domain-containing protein [Solirubrobacteraceae bacterium]|nr:CAP domain-containing protein [Solirubrobacteraceae bacterium]